MTAATAVRGEAPLSTRLRRLGACMEAREWAEGQTLAQVWGTCPRGDWLLWLGGQVAPHGSPLHRRVVLADCACARLALHHVSAGEDRPRVAIETAERWARGEEGVSIEGVRRAARGAAAYADAAAAYAAYAAAAAYAARAAAYADAAAYARDRVLQECADIVRSHVSLADVEAAWARWEAEQG